MLRGAAPPAFDELASAVAARQVEFKDADAAYDAFVDEITGDLTRLCSLDARMFDEAGPVDAPGPAADPMEEDE